LSLPQEVWDPRLGQKNGAHRGVASRTLAMPNHFCAPVSFRKQSCCWSESVYAASRSTSVLRPQVVLRSERPTIVGKTLCTAMHPCARVGDTAFLLTPVSPSWQQTRTELLGPCLQTGQQWARRAPAEAPTMTPFHPIRCGPVVRPCTGHARQYILVGGRLWRSCVPGAALWL